MKKIIMLILAVSILAGGGFYYLNYYMYTEKQPVSAGDYKNAEYIIEGKRMLLGEGGLKFFGNEVLKDLNDDGREDAVFLITHDGGGSGTFYYVVAAINTENGYKGSQALFLGDRIVPQTTEVSKNPSHVNVIVVNYADRAPGESMTVAPSQGKSIWIKLDLGTMQFGEVVQNFEGEADSSRMTLDMKTWNWVKAVYSDGREILPKKQGVFSLKFNKNGRFSATTDCNSMSGKYTVKNSTISFVDIASTLMYCEGSQEGEFAKFLTNSAGYHFAANGELILELKYDGGSAVFR